MLGLPFLHSNQKLQAENEANGHCVDISLVEFLTGRDSWAGLQRGLALCNHELSQWPELESDHRLPEFLCIHDNNSLVIQHSCMFCLVQHQHCNSKNMVHALPMPLVQ